MQVLFSDGTVLRVPPALVRESLERLQKLGFYRESGGILIGVKVANEETYELRRITYPGSLDKRGFFSYLRSKISGNIILRKRWAFTDGQENYLGEWHTHNEEYPIPSSIDIKLVEQVVKDETLPFGIIFLLIIGNSEKAFIGIIHRNSNEVALEGKVVSWRV